MAAEDDAAQKPATVEVYLKWLQAEHDVPERGRLKARYETVATRAREQFLASSFWAAASEGLTAFEADYRLGAYGYPLFVGGPTAPEVVIKPFESFLEKTYRRNVLENDNWPAAPAAGWVIPDTSYDRISDVVRMTFVVKYLDAVRFLCERLNGLAGTNGLSCGLSYAASMEGHYAGHLDLLPTFRIPGMDWEIDDVVVGVEIQITTQLQEVIRNLLHKHYEARRIGATGKGPWQWDYESPEFAANYLGHILHYIEGVIVDVRQEEPTPSTQSKEVGKGDE